MQQTTPEPSTDNGSQSDPLPSISDNYRKLIGQNDSNLSTCSKKKSINTYFKVVIVVVPTETKKNRNILDSKRYRFMEAASKQTKSNIIN